MIWKIIAKFVDYDYLFAHGKIKMFAPAEYIVHTEYRKSRREAETEVFKFLRKIHGELIGQVAPDGERIMPRCTLEDDRFVLEKTYYPKDSHSGHTCFRYTVSFGKVETLPDGEELKRGAFIFNPSYDNNEVTRPLDTITDWVVSGASRYPFKPTWDLFKVNVTTPTGSETASIEFDNRGGAFNLRERQNCNIKMTRQLLDSALKELSKVA